MRFKNNWKGLNDFLNVGDGLVRYDELHFDGDQCHVYWKGTKVAVCQRSLIEIQLKRDKSAQRWILACIFFMLVALVLRGFYGTGT